MEASILDLSGLDSTRSTTLLSQVGCCFAEGYENDSVDFDLLGSGTRVGARAFVPGSVGSALSAGRREKSMVLSPDDQKLSTCEGLIQDSSARVRERLSFTTPLSRVLVQTDLCETLRKLIRNSVESFVGWAIETSGSISFAPSSWRLPAPLVGAGHRRAESTDARSSRRAESKAGEDVTACRERYARLSALLDEWASEPPDFDSRVGRLIEDALRESAPRHFREI